MFYYYIIQHRVRVLQFTENRIIISIYFLFEHFVLPFAALLQVCLFYFKCFYLTCHLHTSICIYGIARGNCWFYLTNMMLFLVSHVSN